MNGDTPNICTQLISDKLKSHFKRRFFFVQNINLKTLYFQIYHQHCIVNWYTDIFTFSHKVKLKTKSMVQLILWWMYTAKLFVNPCNRQSMNLKYVNPPISHFYSSSIHLKRKSANFFVNNFFSFFDQCFKVNKPIFRWKAFVRKQSITIYL